jgi:hypothetical protein
MNPHHLRRMAVRARALARPYAATRVAQSIEQLAGVGQDEGE